MKLLQTLLIPPDQLPQFVFTNENGIYCSITPSPQGYIIKIYKGGF